MCGEDKSDTNCSSTGVRSCGGGWEGGSFNVELDIFKEKGGSEMYCCIDVTPWYGD